MTSVVIFIHIQVHFHLASTGLGQGGQVQLEEGVDFSEEKHSESSNDFELVRRDWSVFDLLGTPSAKSACVPLGGSYSVLFSETGMADLGKMGFGLLIAQGIQEGHTYAVRSREGGVALLYVFDVESPKKDYRSEFSVDTSVENIKFDWIYYPEGLPDTDSSVQPISWGQLKNSLLRKK